MKEISGMIKEFFKDKANLPEIYQRLAMNLCEAVAENPYLNLSRGRRACPPEDCGGTWGYEQMLEIVTDPNHEEYARTIEWLGEDFDPDSDVNPFMHVLIHSAVEGQLESKDPKEVVQFYQAMRSHGYPHHDTIHLMGAILLPLMITSIEVNEPFDLKRYRKLLKKLKQHRPEEIPELLENEPDLYPF